MSRKILFVDDETRVLDALQRMLRPLRSELDASFAANGQNALEMMEKEKFDFIISDIRMPGMDGAELLERVKKEFPDTIRFALSGQSDQETWMRALGSAHQFLSKPCTVEKLMESIMQASSLRGKLHSEAVRNIVSETGSLPSPPHLYYQIMDLMQRPNCSVGEIATVVEKDTAMSAKVLQLINSASIGLHSHVSSPAQAVSMLGLGTLRAMILFVHIFDNFKAHEPRVLRFLESFHSHCMAISQAARKIAKAESPDKNLLQETSVTGMLHDIGRLILASRFPKRYGPLLEKLAKADEQAFVEAEVAEFGASHQETGAYLLALWGLSDPVVEAVAYHHNPSDSSKKAFSPLVAVHVAECLLPAQPPAALKLPPLPSLAPDMNFLSRLGLDGKLDSWKALLGLQPSESHSEQAEAKTETSDESHSPHVPSN